MKLSPPYRVEDSEEETYDEASASEPKQKLRVACYKKSGKTFEHRFETPTKKFCLFSVLKLSFQNLSSFLGTFRLRSFAST